MIIFPHNRLMPITYQTLFPATRDSVAFTKGELDELVKKADCKKPKKKANFNKMMAILSFGLAGVAIFTSGLLRKHQFDYNKAFEIKENQLVYADENRREYSGSLITTLEAGGSRDLKIYIDKRPFGSMDSVRVVTYSSINNYIIYTNEREPQQNEADSFNILEHISGR